MKEKPDQRLPVLYRHWDVVSSSFSFPRESQAFWNVLLRRNLVPRSFSDTRESGPQHGGARPLAILVAVSGAGTGVRGGPDRLRDAPPAAAALPAASWVRHGGVPAAAGGSG